MFTWKSMVAIGVFTASLLGCTVNPTTGRSQLLLMSWEQEMAMGAEAAPQFLSEAGGAYGDTQVVSYVTNIGMRLAQRAGEIDPRLQQLEWEFHVVDSDIVNAFALPGGKVFVTRGLLARMQNEAQLAGVLGHEIGHVSGQHANERMSVAQGAQLISVLAQVGAQATDNEWVDMLGVGVGVGGQLTTLKFSRSNETEADELGVRYMADLGWNPSGQVQVMTVLHEASGDTSQPEWLSTHPAPETRIRDLERLIQQQYPQASTVGSYRWGETEYQRQILQRLAFMPAAGSGDLVAFVQLSEMDVQMPSCTCAHSHQPL